MATVTADFFLDQIHNVPSIPKTIRELMVEFDAPETNVDRVVELISTDPALAVKILRLANSSFYGRRSSVERLPDAIVFIGTHAARNLVMAVGLTASVHFPAGFPKESFWRYSLHSAVAARYLAQQARQDGAAAFAVGLMRAVGEPLLINVKARELSALDRDIHFFDERRADAERDRIGFSFVDISAALAQRWHFPEQMVDALRQSQTLSTPSNAGKLGALVSVGAWVAGEYERSKNVPDDATDHLEASLRVANLPWQVVRDMPSLPELSAGLEELVR